jgi:ABC-2 type transport system permease protein
MSGARLTWLVARRELREGIRGRTFLVSTVVMLVLLAGLIALPAVLGNQAQQKKVGVVGALPTRLAPALARAAKPFDLHFALRRYPSFAAAREAVAKGKVDAALVGGGRRLLVRPDPPGDVVSIVTAAVRSAGLQDLVDRLGITRAQAEAVLAPPLALHEVEATRGSDESARVLAYASTVLLFVALSIYGQAVLMGVVQEKASRVVELLLASLRPRHLLAGKVAGIGVLGLAQIAVLVGAALAAGAAGLFDLPTLGRTAPLALLWFLLGYAFYATAFAAVGALVSRTEDASGASLPVTGIMLVSYLLAFGGAFSNPDSAAAIVLSLVPFSAPFVVPARVAVTDVPLWQHLLAVALMLAATAGLVRLGGRIYELGLLRSGARVPFREALRTALSR